MTPGHHRAVHMENPVGHNDPSLKQIWTTSMDKVLGLYIDIIFTQMNTTDIIMEYILFQCVN